MKIITKLLKVENKGSFLIFSVRIKQGAINKHLRIYMLSVAWLPSPEGGYGEFWGVTRVGLILYKFFILLLPEKVSAEPKVTCPQLHVNFWRSETKNRNNKVDGHNHSLVYSKGSLTFSSQLQTLWLWGLSLKKFYFQWLLWNKLLSGALSTLTPSPMLLLFAGVCVSLCMYVDV